MTESNLYNIRLMKSYVEYIQQNYPEIDIGYILNYAGVERCELNDLGYWYTQEQADRFNEIITKETGNRNISREAGRLLATSQAHETMRRYLIGLITPVAIYTSAEFNTPKFTRGSFMQARKLGRNKVEVISKPNKNINEKPYQCENRMGILEAVPMIFANKLPRIDHPECIHKGDDCCKYIISWDEPFSFKIKRIRNYFTVIFLLLSIFIFLYFSTAGFIYFISLCGALSFIISFISEKLKNNEFSKNIETQSNAADQLLDEINNRYNNALLIQEVGKAISTILDTDKLFVYVMQVLEKRTDFERGIILLANEDETRLVFKAGYGYDPEKETILKETEFHLDKPGSKGVFIKTYKEKNPVLVSDINEITKTMSQRSREYAETIGTQSFISVPIVFKEKALGILAVDNVISKRILTKSDVNLLDGIAQQIGISINNARSFQELQRSEEKYRELVENANSIIMRMDIEGRITFFNEFAQKFFGFSEDELLGKKALGTIVPDDRTNRSRLNNILTEIDKDPQRYVNIQSENIIRNGGMVWIAWTNRPVYDDEGRLSEILCIGNDISQIKENEDKIEHLNELLLTIRNIDQLINHEKDRDKLVKGICDKLVLTRGHVNAWIALFDEEEKFAGAFESGFNGEFRKLLEKIKGEISLPCARMALEKGGTVVISDPVAECKECPVSERYKNTGRIANRLTYNKRVYGILSVEVEKEFLENEEVQLLLQEVAGDIAFALYSIELEAEKKSLQEQLFQTAKLSAVGELAAGVAHEFNNILSGILGHAQMSLMEKVIPDVRDSLTEIESATKRGSNLVKSLSDFARPREPEFEIQDITGIIDETLNLQKKQISVGNIEVVRDYNDYSEVLFDQGQMGQVFLNLLINALHAMQPKGRGKITISVRDIEGFLEVRFSDTGSGMSEETRQKIFEPFFSTKGANSKDGTEIAGSGLGLSVTHGIIKQHKGTIDVESEEGKGTSFIIRLPREDEGSRRKAGIGADQADSNGDGTKDLKIMVIDDEDEMINLMKLIFKKTGFNNYVTENKSKSAARVFEDYGPDVVFLDLLMPQMNGEQVLAELRTINKDVPVIFMSGKFDLEEDECREKGAYAFVKKPFDVNSIFNILERVAGEKGVG